MSILSDFMRLLDGFGRSGDSMSNNATGFASNESGTREQYAWASPREASAAVPRQQPSGSPIGGLTKAQTANIIFNEVRSLSSPGGNEDLLYKYMAHTIWNGGEFEPTRPKTAGTSVTVSPGERNTYNAIKAAVDQAYDDRKAGRIPLPRNVVHFVLQPNLTTAAQRLSANPKDPDVEWATVLGPFNNSYTGGGLPRTGVHVNFYYNKPTSVQIQSGRATGYDDN